MKLEDIKVTYEVRREERVSIITPVLEVDSDSVRTLIAFLKVDGHELISSQRIRFENGPNRLTLKPVKIVKTPGFEESYEYRMELHISPDGKEYHIDQFMLRLL
ncbi:MAG: hypothetical protein A2020_08925 [Lentisphaerae bacterium GWF2_45_14]|nr:MAG: hypothetical protein A2020_08925 [Lentisphaerae bacterium GWF2_45_14]